MYGIARLVFVWQALAAQLKERRETESDKQLERHPPLNAFSTMYVKAKALSFTSLYPTPTTNNMTPSNAVEVH